MAGSKPGAGASALASTLLLIAICSAILPPGYAAYIGAYLALVASIVALAIFGWSERTAVRHPTSLAILAAILLVLATLPFVYRGGQDLLGPVLVLPMLATVAMGLLARPARWVPGVPTFALVCCTASAIALIGGAYQHFGLGMYRPGLGNNPIHYGSLAAMAGGLALVGVVSGSSSWRYLFLLGPVFGLAAAVISDSRGPMLGALAMGGVGIVTLFVWLRHDRWFQVAAAAGVVLAVAIVTYLVGSGNARIAGILHSGLDIFRFSGGTDDTRAALYASAIEMLRASPVVGVGLGQIMVTAETLFPQQVAGTGLENLHADWANFGAMAGGLGLLAWALLLAAPLLLLLDTRVRSDRPILLGAILLTTGQFTLGISNATFGILPQTTIYAVGLGYFLVRARRIALEATQSRNRQPDLPLTQQGVAGG